MDSLARRELEGVGDRLIMDVVNWRLAWLLAWGTKGGRRGSFRIH